MPNVGGDSFPYTREGIQKAAKKRAKILTSDGMMLGDRIKDARKRMKAGVVGPNVRANDLIQATRRKAERILPK